MRSRTTIIIAIVVLGTLAAVAYMRSGLLKLPSIPAEVTAHAAGLDGLAEMKSIDNALRGVNSSSNSRVASAISALGEINRGDEEAGIEHLENVVRNDPEDLVVGNLLRMELLTLKRKQLAANAERREIALQLPEYLNDQPVRFFRELLKNRPSREVKLQLALSLVDHMLLFPALEIKAPSSVEAVEILTDIVNGGNQQDAYYVPALYARGLNYLYRPFNLVWPERIAAPANAASNDISLAVAIGQKIDSGSDVLKAELSLSLGDAYAKEGKLSLARSWWQIANNMAHDEKFRQRVFTRLQWNDDDLAANLEETLQHQMEDLDHPLSDLRFMWQ